MSESYCNDFFNTLSVFLSLSDKNKKGSYLLICRNPTNVLTAVFCWPRAHPYENTFSHYARAILWLLCAGSRNKNNQVLSQQRNKHGTKQILSAQEKATRAESLNKFFTDIGSRRTKYTAQTSTSQRQKRTAKFYDKSKLLCNLTKNFNLNFPRKFDDIKWLIRNF